MKAEHRIVILSHLDDRARDQLCECIHEILYSSRVASRKRLRTALKLIGHSHDLRSVADSSKTRAHRKKKLVQIGGSPMSVLLNAAIPHLAEIFRT